ncbi:hypothetical protein JOD01_003927 [Brevibacillus fulvus]|uniref:Uncharacterized protein n=1 Tax=Brevibacillus fulvus TaxID=1125967 RepID=A0A938Y2T6_9BACL|nr:hypothetical protein [Brevibacillus fulvus]
MGRRERIQAQLNLVNQRLEMYYKAEAAVLIGAQSYQMGQKQITRATLPSLQNQIQELERRKEELETALATGADKRKAVRVLFRDL